MWKELSCVVWLLSALIVDKFVNEILSNFSRLFMKKFLQFLNNDCNNLYWIVFVLYFTFLICFVLCVCVCVYVRMNIYVCMCNVCMYICMCYVCMYVYMYVCMDVCMCVYVLVYIYLLVPPSLKCRATPVRTVWATSGLQRDHFTLYIYMWTHVCRLWTYVRTYVRRLVCLFVCLFVCMHIPLRALVPIV